MEKELVFFRQNVCDHTNQSEQYTRQRFDILNGYELKETKCIKCHKLLLTKISKLADSGKS
jgi:hypothetical protein